MANGLFVVPIGSSAAHVSISNMYDSFWPRKGKNENKNNLGKN